MQWEKITDIILIAAIAVLGVFALMGLIEWIKRKSLKKVDIELTAMFPPLVLMAISYVVFDKFIILSTRPNGSGEPSFPSSHTMVVATIFLMAMVALPKYIKNKPLRALLSLVMAVMIGLVTYGRVAANMHWPADVAGGLAFAIVFSGIYYVIIKRFKKE